MCGIAAIFAYDPDAPSVNESDLLAIRDRMAARGPDGAGIWLGANDRIGLAHRRLSIIDLSPAGAQPMRHPDRDLTIVFNGEIYNYQELRKSLEQKGHKFRSTSDTEVLLHLYAEHGEKMVHHLRGMFAFAIWDGVKQGLFVARDPFGIKPIYIADDGKIFRLASQVKALLADPNIETELDPAGHVGFFLWGHIPEPYTLYRTIRSLPAGSSLWIDAQGGRHTNTYCSITQILRDAESSPLPTPYSELPAPRSPLPALLQDTVRHHLIADVPVGVFLSAGLDSTTLAALAAEQGGILRTVTLGFEEYRGTANDETPLAEVVARQYNAQHQTIWISREDFVSEREQLFDAMDQPSTDGVNTYFVSLAARRAGLKVALSGLGGDELFGGYPSFSEIPRIANALRFMRPGNLLGRTFRAVSTPILKKITSPKYAGLLEYGGGYSGAYLLRRGMFMPWELPDVLDGEIVREGWSELQTLMRLDETLSDLRTPRARVSALELTWYMRNQLLRDSDWAGMAHSLEIRVPLVDIQLLRSIAPSLVSASPPTKLDMAHAPRSPLPASILSRPKTGFQIPVRDWLETAGSREHGAGSKKVTNDRGLRGWAKHIYAESIENGRSNEAAVAESPLPHSHREKDRPLIITSSR